MYGTRIGFYSGDVKELLNDVKYMAPTIFASVPRLLNRVYDKVSQNYPSANSYKEKLNFGILNQQKSRILRILINYDQYTMIMCVFSVHTFLGCLRLPSQGIEMLNRISYPSRVGAC
mgnify:FL=1